nr:MAG TPA: hypothetical protein [Caudoviricetes sp.]
MAIVKTALQGIAATGFNVGDAMNIGFGVMDYKNAREEGNNRGVSLAKAAGSFAWGELFYGGASSAISGGLTKVGISGLANGALTMGATVGLTALMASGQIASAVWQNNAQQMAKGYASNGKLGSGHFNMTESGYTMRQRSLNAIRSNGMNMQSALGNEARQYVR